MLGLSRIALSLCFAGLFAVAGCGGGDGSVKVSGKVTVKGGGPVTQGIVQLQSDAASGSGPINASGEFTIAGGGVPAGKYKAVFLSTSTGGGYDKPDEPEKRVIDIKYETAATSIDATVDGSPLNFELDPPSGGGAATDADKAN